MVVRSVRHKGLKRLIEDDDARGIPPDLIRRVRNVLAVLILAENWDEFIDNAPPGWRIHQLAGERKGTWSVSVSGNWRITFVETNGDIEHLDLEDYH